MLQRLGQHIVKCWERAVAAEHKAAMAGDESTRSDFLQIAQSWRNLALSYQFADTLERFLLDADRAKRSPPDDPELLE